MLSLNCGTHGANAGRLHTLWACMQPGRTQAVAALEKGQAPSLLVVCPEQEPRNVARPPHTHRHTAERHTHTYTHSTKTHKYTCTPTDSRKTHWMRAGNASPPDIYGKKRQAGFPWAAWIQCFFFSHNSGETRWGRAMRRGEERKRDWVEVVRTDQPYSLHSIFYLLSWKSLCLWCKQESGHFFFLPPSDTWMPL